jgi:hypothetical protein
VDGAEGPPAGQHRTDTVGGPRGVAREPVPRAEQVRGLVVVLTPHRLLQRDHFGPQAPEPVAQDLAPPVPVRVLGRQQVQGEDVHRGVPCRGVPIVVRHRGLLIASQRDAT